MLAFIYLFSIVYSILKSFLVKERITNITAGLQTGGKLLISYKFGTPLPQSKLL